MSLQIKICHAVLTHDTEMFSNMDPYCILTLGRQEYRSRTIKQGGKKPVWNQTFNFGGMENKLIIKVMDQDTLSDDLIGEASLDLSKFRMMTQEHKEIVQLSFKGESAGKIQLIVHPQGNSKTNTKPSTPQVIQQTYRNPNVHQPNNPPVKPVSSYGMQNHGMQVVQGISPGNQLGTPQPQQTTINRPNTMFGDLSSNNGWGNFDPNKVPQNNSLGNQAIHKDNPFSMLGDALSKRGGLNGMIGNQSMPNYMGGMGGGLGMAGYQAISQPQMLYSPYYPHPIYR